MNLGHTILMGKQSQLSIDDLEDYLNSIADSYGYIKSKTIGIKSPEHLHIEDALELLKFHFIQRSFYGTTNS
jgi:hypothetical protein